MKLVIVESPTKANTIGRYLPPDYQVLASLGHVRDLPSKDGSVLPDQDFAMVYEPIPRTLPYLKKIVTAAKKSDQVFLATDPDREGEAIAWHIAVLLRDNKQLKTTPLSRITFHEITGSAISEALQHPQEINRNLVDAQQARRALDYLVGFKVSPILWRKLPGSSSAGRVQSVALRLICEQENKRDAFQAQKYWSLKATFRGDGQAVYQADLTVANGQKLKKMDITSAQQAQTIKSACEKCRYRCTRVKRRNTDKAPVIPFITSTLQQEAANKLRMSPSKTMQIAQQLYEGVKIGKGTSGLITYMRTDSSRMSSQFVSKTKSWISENFGTEYVGSKSGYVKRRVKNAQEAHECIRPTNVTSLPGELKAALSEQQYALYDLIWRRSVASLMTAARYEVASAEISSTDEQFVFALSVQKMLFDGFTKLYNGYRVGSDQELELTAGSVVGCEQVATEEHTTEPPARFTEASLIRMLESKGIGRPSTYAPIMELLVKRNYARLQQRQFHPTPLGRLVTAFLQEFFTKYVSYDFTAAMEKELDDIAQGKVVWKAVMQRFWEDFYPLTQDLLARDRQGVLATLEEAMAPLIFAGPDKNLCRECKTGRLHIKPSKNAVFLGCSNYPACKYTCALFERESKDQIIGEDAGENSVILLRQGPFGSYLQKNQNGETVKRVSLPDKFKTARLDYATAKSLVALPKLLGQHPVKQLPVSANWGRFGGYVTCDGVFVSVASIDRLINMDLTQAVVLLTAKEQKLQKSALGEHPQGGTVYLRKVGKFRYLSHNKQRLRVDATSEIDLTKAIELLGESKKKSTTGKVSKAKKKAKSGSRSTSSAKSSRSKTV